MGPGGDGRASSGGPAPARQPVYAASVLMAGLSFSPVSLAGSLHPTRRRTSDFNSNAEGAIGKQEESYEDCAQEQGQDPTVPELAPSQESTLDKYLDQCGKLGVKAETLVLEEWDIAEGILELVDRFWITTLVMGAASDKHYSKEMTVPQSKKAMKLMENAHPFCEILFVCNRKLIFTRNSSADLRSVPVFVDAADDVWETENSLESERYLLGGKTQEISEQDDVAQNVEEMQKRGSLAIIEELHDVMVPAQVNAVRDVELLNQQEQEMITESSEVSELHLQCKQLMTERDNALRKVTFLEGQKKQMAIENNVSIKEIVELGKRNIKITAERDNALGEVKTFRNKAEKAETEVKELQEEKQRMMTELNCARKEMVELQNQQKQITIEKDNALGEMGIFCNQDEQAKTEFKKLQKENERMMTKLNFADARLVELCKQKDLISVERDDTLRELEEHDRLMQQVLVEQENAVREIEVLRREKHKMTLEVMEGRRQKVLMMAERDRALQAVETLMAWQEQIKLERGSAVRQMAKLREPEAQMMPTNYIMPSSQFTLAELMNATQNFSDSFKIGRGGFGVVYKGFLRNTKVAIKMLSSTSVQGQSEFKQEVTILSTVRHPNLVTLVGACPEVRALVYEFMPNGSLEDHLDCKAGAPPLSWLARTRIISEICSALSFLHKNKPSAVVHGDIKPANILLDGNLVSKLSDFGMSRLLIQSGAMDGSSMYCCTSHPWGTPGYVDPEFYATGELTPRSDTYSFGVTILCVLTAKSPLNLAGVVGDALKRGELRSVMDTSAGEWPIEQASQLAMLALRCTDRVREMRPDMTGEVWNVVKHLADEVDEASAGSNGRHDIGVPAQLNGQDLGAEDRDSPVHPWKCLSGIKIQSRK